jgi:hypothetical protein
LGWCIYLDNTVRVYIIANIKAISPHTVLVWGILITRDTMAKLPSEVLKKTKQTDEKEGKGEDKDDKKPRKNAMLNWIAKNKKG